ncbi:unnamed protein product [Chrysoparadoxa australica]
MGDSSLSIGGPLPLAGRPAPLGMPPPPPPPAGMLTPVKKASPMPRCASPFSMAELGGALKGLSPMASRRVSVVAQKAKKEMEAAQVERRERQAGAEAVQQWKRELVDNAEPLASEGGAEVEKGVKVLLMVSKDSPDKLHIADTSRLSFPTNGERLGGGAAAQVTAAKLDGIKVAVKNFPPKPKVETFEKIKAEFTAPLHLHKDQKGINVPLAILFNDNQVQIVYPLLYTTPTLSAFMWPAGGSRSSQTPLWQRAAMFGHVLRSVVQMHDSGYVHLDMKPDNVGITWSDGELQAVLIDWDTARRCCGVLVPAGTGGTAGYSSSDRLEGPFAGPPADYFSVACMGVECLTGTRVAGKDRAFVLNELNKWESSGDDFAQKGDLCSCLRDGLSKNPKERPSCSELESCFETYLKKADLREVATVVEGTTRSGGRFRAG